MPKSSKTKATDPIHDVRNAIIHAMHRQSTSHEFICKRALKQVWPDGSLSQIFPTYDQEELRTIRKDYICVLSILVYIGWTDMSRFRPLFLREAARKDAHLPFTIMDFLGASERMFSLHQHAFIPIIIEEHNKPHIQDIPTERRLPFIHEPESVGNGGYGSVTKRVIASRYLRNEEDNTENSKPKAVACKVYTAEKPSQNYQDFEKEVGNLNFVKESLTESKRVMKHIAAIVHGDKFMIILPLANLRNLEIFLRCGFEPNPSTGRLRSIYDFDVRFPMLDKSSKLQRAVVEEAHQLASALKWLHEDLTIFGLSDRYLAHMDLKPANILLEGDPGDPRSPAGKWMLSDFGVSAFDKATNAKVSDTPSIGDVGHRFTSRGLQDRVVRGHGSYQPPEVDLEDVDNRKCDVWSFGCVLCDILAFAIGKSVVVQELRNLRFVRGDDFFYETTSPTPKMIKEIDESNTKLKSQIVEWWESLEHSPASSSAKWVIEYIKVLRGALRSKPSDRPGIREIVHDLNALATSITAQADGPLPTNFHLAPSVPHPDGLASQQTSEAPHRRPSITISHEVSQQTPERNGIRNVALTGGSQVHTSPNLLSPESASQREPALPTRHEGDGIHDSSGTESPDHSTPLAETTCIDINEPERGPPDWPVKPSSERQTAIVYRERSKISISLPKKEQVTAVAITPSTLQVAILFKHSVQIYSTTNGNEIGQPIILSSKVKWTKIRLASEYFAVYGLGTCREKHIELYHYDLVVTAMAPDLIIPGDGNQPQDILLSDKNVFAYVYVRSVELYFVRQRETRIIEITEYNEDNAFIIDAKFGASGKFLCVWTSGDGADHAYFFSVNEEVGSAIPCGGGSYQKARYTLPSERVFIIIDSQQTNTNSVRYNLWPLFDSPACLIHEAHGDVFLAQCLDRPQAEPQKRNSIRLSNALIACVVGEDVLVCMMARTFHYERRMCAFALQEPKGQRGIAGQSQDLCAANKGIRKSTASAARVVGGKGEIVLCTISGKVLRYVQS